MKNKRKWEKFNVEDFKIDPDEINRILKQLKGANLDLMGPEDSIIVHYAPIDDNSVIKELKFNSKGVAFCELFSKPAKGIVYLLADECASGEGQGEIFITENSEMIALAFRILGNTLYIQEYESYEAAYEVALLMREPNKLCYDK